MSKSYKLIDTINYYSDILLGDWRKSNRIRESDDNPRESHHAEIFSLRGKRHGPNMAGKVKTKPLLFVAWLKCYYGSVT